MKKRKYKKSYLFEQFENFQKLFPEIKIIRQYKDVVGVHALLCRRSLQREFLFVAKNSSNKGIVSIHEDTIKMANQYNLQIVMCLLGNFWKFYGHQILPNMSYKNEYNGAKMVNFYLSRVGAEKIPLNTVTEASLNFGYSNSAAPVSFL